MQLYENWKKRFERFILLRGETLYRAGNVIFDVIEDGYIAADVKGQSRNTYRVEIENPSSEEMEMTCDCAYAKQQKCCKHMAAVLYAAEARLEENQEMNRIGANGSRNKPNVKTGEARRKALEALEAYKGMANKIAEEKEAIEAHFRPHDAVEQYRYFDTEAMAEGLKVSTERWKAAKELAESGAVVLREIRFGQLKNFGMLNVLSGGKSDEDESPDLFGGMAIGEYTKTSKTRWNYGTQEISLVFSGSSVIEATCSADTCWKEYRKLRGSGSRDMCEHMLALLWLAAEQLIQQNPGDATNISGNLLMRSFGRIRQLQSKDSGYTVRTQLEKPIDMDVRLNIKPYNGELSATFKVGEGRLYVIKKLEDFSYTIDMCSEMQFGKNTVLTLNPANFTERARVMSELIRTAVHDIEEQNRYQNANAKYYAAELRLGNELPLYGRYLDRLFDILKNETQVECADGFGYSSTEKCWLRMREMNISPKLSLHMQTDKRGQFSCIRIKGEMPPVYRGERYVYCIKDGCLNRMEPDAWNLLQPMQAVSPSRKIDIRIGRKNLTEFYRTMLPVLKEHMDISVEDEDEIQRYIPPQVQFAFYLDAEDDAVVCRAEAQYGDARCMVSDFSGLPQSDVLPQPETHPAAIPQEQRDRRAETDVCTVLDGLFDEIKADGSFAAFEESHVYQLLDQGIDRLLQLGEVHMTDRLRSINVRKKPKINVGVKMESGLMNLSVSSDELSMDELLALLESYRKKKRYHRLRDGSFVRTDEDGIGELEQMLAALRITPKEFVKGKMQIPAYRALYLDKMLEETEGLYANRDKRFKQLIKEFKTVQDSDFEVPDDLKTVLRRYQKTGYRWLRTLMQYGFGGILADDMGLGKTLQMIAVLKAMYAEGETLRTLIITPASLVYNWADEFRRFAPELSVQVLGGTAEERRALIEAGRKTERDGAAAHETAESATAIPVTVMPATATASKKTANQKTAAWQIGITSYDILKRDIDLYEGETFACEVLDEAQYIKNHTTAAAKSVKLVKSAHRFALTGTPIENTLSELWSIFDYLMPGFLYTYEVFRKELETPIAKNGDEAASQRLKRMVSPFILRRLKTDVLKDLPEKLEEVRVARMEGEQRRLYDAQVLRIRQMLEKQDDDEFRKNKLRVLAELTRIRQLCCDPALCLERYRGSAAKLDLALELIQSAAESGHRMLVFSQFTSMLSILEQALQKAGIAYYKITGETPKEKRLELVRAFNEDQTPVFLISLKAGGTGLNLTGADMVLHYDPWWNLAAQNQATDRAHRIGQTKKVTVYKLIVQDSIEEKIVQMQEQKKALADEILSGDEISAGSISKEDLLALLQ